MSAAYVNPAYDKDPPPYQAYASTDKNATVFVQVEQKGEVKEGITYSWDKVNVFAKITQGFGRNKKTQEKHILKDVSGLVRPGELLAIMGASGAGKTTLLNALTFRSDLALKIIGKLYVNGVRVTPDLLTSRSAYVQQDDLFIGTFTVKEQLLFQAHLRMDRQISQQQRVQRVEEVMQELSLVKCAKTLIGVPDKIKGISGGETKRLAFACEVLTDPPLMFLDEPTSGLDSFMAQTVVQAMKNMAGKGKAMICTIHQPSSEVFALFDRVLLMAEGRVAYLGSTKGALSFFSGLGYNCPTTYNPADFFISTLAIEPEREKECRALVQQTCDTFTTSSESQDLARLINVNMKPLPDDSPAMRFNNPIKASKSPYKATSLQQYKALMKRSFLANIRAPSVLRAKVFQAIAIALLTGLIYLDQSYDQKGINNINGALFLLLTQISFSNSFGVINEFCSEVPIFLREHFNGMYRSDIYFMTKNMAEMPFTIVLPFVFTGISYYMIGLYPPAENYFICTAILIMAANVSVSYGYLVSCLAKDISMALALSAPLLIPLMLFGGFFLNSGNIPVYFIWIRYITWFSYGNEALMINQWTNVENITCEIDDGFCVYTGKEILDNLSFNADNMGFDFGLMFVLMIGFRIIAFLLLLLKTRRKTVINIE